MESNTWRTAPLLSLLIWLPILGGALALMLGNGRPQAARWLALGTALLTLRAQSIPLFTGFDYANARHAVRRIAGVDPGLRHPLRARRGRHLDRADRA